MIHGLNVGYDVQVGLQNNLHRWYDATVGAWISQDPIGFEAGDANLYRYVGNRVTKWVDPKGLSSEYPDYVDTLGSRWRYDPITDQYVQETEVDHNDETDQHESIEEQQRLRRKGTPDVTDPDEEWEGSKRPKESGLENIDKSRQRNRRFGLECTAGDIAFGTGVGVVIVGMSLIDGPLPFGEMAAGGFATWAYAM